MYKLDLAAASRLFDTELIMLSSTSWSSELSARNLLISFMYVRVSFVCTSGVWEIIKVTEERLDKVPRSVELAVLAFERSSLAKTLF